MKIINKSFIYGLLLSTLLPASLAHADSLKSQRQRYQQTLEAWDNQDMAKVKKLMPTLKAYPLYPYLVYREMSEKISDLTKVDVDTFSDTYQETPLANQLAVQFKDELFKREDWVNYLDIANNKPKKLDDKCNLYTAKLKLGQTKGMYSDVREMWLSGAADLQECKTLFAWWKKAGGQTSWTTLEHMRLALVSGNNTLFNQLAKELPKEFKTMKNALTALQKDPRSLRLFSKQVGPSKFTKAVTESFFPRVVSKDASAARKMLPTLVANQGLTPAAEKAMKTRLLQNLTRANAHLLDAKWRDAQLVKSKSTPLLEARVRLALSTGKPKEIALWLARLPPAAKNSEVWRYFRGVNLIALGNKKEGEALLKTLVNGRSFYSMAAAQKLGVEFKVRSEKVTPTLTDFSDRDAIKRVIELEALDEGQLARTEWIRYVMSRPVSEQRDLAVYAHEKSWGALSVQATILAKMWNNLEERFPVQYEKFFEKGTKGSQVTPSYGMAISRQESAWDPSARSWVGASGLMQLMPPTAKEMAGRYGLTEYKSAEQLTDPEINIKLGTGYLKYLFDRFDNNRILATAAYNAGPTRSIRWKAQSDDRLDAMAFIEIIPFNETRSYVKNVLMYDVFYHYFMTGKNKPLFNKHEWTASY